MEALKEISKEIPKEIPKETPVTLVIFMGQSNMAGRGEASKAKKGGEAFGWEFRPISDPERLYPMAEPFGFYENLPGKIDDGAMKTGGMACAFAETYYQKTGCPIVGVSAAIGGTSSDQWVQNLAEDAAARLISARRYLERHEKKPRHIYMVWCQGETDGDHGVSKEVYKRNFARIFKKMQNAGAEKCFFIQIGHFNYISYPDGDGVKTGKQIDEQYGVIREAQEEICRESDSVVMAASFQDCLAQMKDSFHYHQEAYDQVGRAAAEAAAETEKETA